PLLGAKVLPGETDLALPGPLPFILSRTYSSYRTRTPAPVGVFGPGWKAPSDIRLQLRDDALVLNDNGGRSIHFEPLLPGEHDEESGLYYNRHRHYDPLQGRYITPDPIGLRGGWNMYQYPLNPIQVIDPMGLDAIENMTSGGLIYAVSGVPGLIAANSITNSAYQFGYDMDAIVGGAHNGAADAMRHCYLMCRMTKTFGSTIADVIGKNHEAAGDRQGQPAKERIMDLKNNTVGIACGDFSAKCSDACIEKYNTGQLFGLDGIKADNPIKAKQGSSDASNY
ncbi:RHS repeat-associated core domain-containing protein, partial [Escherichia coli]